VQTIAPRGQRLATNSSVIDVLDHVLDKGIVIDAVVQVSLVGVNLVTVEARVIVASIQTYLKHAEVVAYTPALRQPAFQPTHPTRIFGS